MNLMNTQNSRVGKLQLEVDQRQAGVLARALVSATITATTAEQLRDITDVLSWLDRRSMRRWGKSVARL